MTEYDPQILQETADKLYQRAGTIQRERTLVGGFLGLVLGYVGSVLTGFAPGVLMVPLGILAALLMRASAADRVLRLRFEAQVALCQREIERHLR